MTTDHNTTLLHSVAFSLWIHQWEPKGDLGEYTERQLKNLYTCWRDVYLPSLQTDHSGSCTKHSCVCIRCITESYISQAFTIIQLLPKNGTL
jgi:hypothetical protein